jgi:O-antigen/teichoic acid export membrane protein
LHAGSAAHNASAEIAAERASNAHPLVTRALNIMSGQTERDRAQRNAMVAFSVRCTSALILYATQIILARWMGGYEYGIYVFVWTWVIILGGISHLGLGLAAIRLAPMYREIGDFNHLRGLMRGVRLMAVAGGTMTMMIGLVATWLIQDRLEDHYILPIYLGLLCIPLFTLAEVQDGIGRSQGWMSVGLIPPYVLRPFLLLATMVAAHEYGLEMLAATAAGAAVLATWCAGSVQTYLVNANLRSEIPAGPRAYDFKAWLKTSLPFLLIITCELLLQNTDILVISRFLTPTDVGIYFAAAKTMALIMFVHYAVGSAVAHRFSALHARGDHDGLRNVFKDAVNWTFWPSLAGAIVILTFSKPILSLFGPQFTSGYPVMCILIVGFLFRSAMGPAEHLLNMLGHQVLCAKVLSAAAALNLALNFALVPTWGLIGAACATSLSLIAVALLNYIVVWRRLGIPIAIWHNLPMARR